MLKSEISKPNTFLYYSYGGNLLTFRIHMNAPSAEFVSIARLDNYRLDFIKYSTFWGGPTAALVPTANAHVWGVIWRLHVDDNDALNDLISSCAYDDYKLVLIDLAAAFGLGSVKYVTVQTPYMGSFICRAYTQKVIPLPRGDNDEIPIERWPSWTYKQIMILGAKEHEMPEYYIKYLKKLKHNGEEGALRTVCLLRRYANNKLCLCRVPGKIPRKPLKLDLKKLKKGGKKKTSKAKPKK